MGPAYVPSYAPPCGSPMQPAPEQMVGNGEWMRSRQAVRVLPPDHQGRFRAVEPAHVLQFVVIDHDVLVGRARRASDHQRRWIGPGLRHVIGDVGAADSGFLENLAANRVLDGLGRLDEAGQAGIHAGRELLLPAEQDLVAELDQHDHDRVGTGKMLGLAASAFALPAAILHRGARAAIGAKAVALMPAHHRFRHRDRRELVRRDGALHRHAAQLGDRDVAAADQLFRRGRRNPHAEHRRAVAQAQKHRAGIGAEFQRLLDRQQCAHTALLLLHHQRIAIDDVGTGIAPALQREQLFLIGAQMRGAVENIGDESRPPERKFLKC